MSGTIPAITRAGEHVAHSDHNILPSNITSEGEGSPCASRIRLSPRRHVPTDRKEAHETIMEGRDIAGEIDSEQ